MAEWTPDATIKLLVALIDNQSIQVVAWDEIAAQLGNEFDEAACRSHFDTIRATVVPQLVNVTEPSSTTGVEIMIDDCPKEFPEHENDPSANESEAKISLEYVYVYHAEVQHSVHGPRIKMVKKKIQTGVTDEEIINVKEEPINVKEKPINVKEKPNNTIEIGFVQGKIDPTMQHIIDRTLENIVNAELGFGITPPLQYQLERA